MNSVFGAHGSPEQRAVNFSWLALGFSISNSIGPLVAGYAIDGLGHARAFAVLAVFPADRTGSCCGCASARCRAPSTCRSPKRAGVLDLLRIPGLRQTFWVSLLLATGWDLFTFIDPALRRAHRALGRRHRRHPVDLRARDLHRAPRDAGAHQDSSSNGRSSSPRSPSPGPATSLFPLAQSVPPLLAAVVRARPRARQRAAGDHVAALRGLAARAPGRGGRPAHLAPQRQPYPHPARLRRGVAPRSAWRRCSGCSPRACSAGRGSPRRQQGKSPPESQVESPP